MLVTVPEDFNKYVIKNTQDGKYHCTICNEYSHAGITLARNHVESKHFPGTFTYSCDICDEIFTTRINANNHKARKHKF